jgi:hypothetical protein
LTRGAPGSTLGILREGLRTSFEAKETRMKELSEGGLEQQGGHVAVWYDQQEDTVVVQCDFVDLNFYRDDFMDLVEVLKEAADRLMLESPPEL